MVIYHSKKGKNNHQQKHIQVYSFKFDSHPLFKVVSHPLFSGIFESMIDVPASPFSWCFSFGFVAGAPCRFGLQVLRVEYRLQDPSLGGRFGSGEDDDLDRDRELRLETFLRIPWDVHRGSGYLVYNWLLYVGL